MALTKVGKEGVTGISNSSNATAITIDSSENVGIGVTDPSTWSLGKALHIGNKENNLWGEADYAFHMSQNAYYNGGWKYSHTDEATRYSQEDGQHIWSYAGSGSANAALTWLETMRLDTSGVLLHNKTVDDITNGGLHIRPIGTTCSQIRIVNDSGSSQYLHSYYGNSSNLVGSITNGHTGVAFNTSSDYRLKENVTYDWDATTRLKQLKPARFEWIADGDDAVPVDGFLAHEAQAVVPEAVTGTHNEVDDDGNAVMQGIDQSKIVPLLAKSLQEAIAKIETLETKVQALEDA